MTDEKQKTFETLKDDFETSADEIRDNIYYFINDLNELLDRFDNAQSVLGEVLSDDLNELITWGFVPGAKAQLTLDGKAVTYTFVGYCEGNRMQFRSEDDGREIYSRIKATAATLDKWTLLQKEDGNV